MANSELQVAKRTVLGKKVATLRRDGITPANIFGHKVESTAVQVGTNELTHLLRASSRNAIINVSVEGEGAPRTVVVRDLKRHAVTGRLLHVDFYQVSMTEKMRADVPVVLVGHADAVSTYQGILLQTLESIAIEALPADIPAQFECDVTPLTELDTSIHVRDLAIDTSKITLHTDLDVVVARVAAPRLAAEEAAPEAAAEGAPEGEGAAEAGQEQPAADEQS
jgi:large subunit ribosomal protein L25